MEDTEFARLYFDRYQKALAEPEDSTDVTNILNCIRARHGFLDKKYLLELRSLSPASQRMWISIANNARQQLAQSTNLASDQLYDDPFRFFYEILQNADDAIFPLEQEPPTISFTLQSDRLVIFINEEGFKLKDVLAICNTGHSSKRNSVETTGEKGLGFKSVFKIATKVSIQSGLWSFHFEHKQGDDGLGKVTPISDSQNVTASKDKTTITLCLSNTSPEAMENLCCRLEEQSATLLYALRKIEKIIIAFDNVSGRCKEHVFEKLPSRSENELEIVSNVNGNVETCAFYTWKTSISDMPPCEQSRCSQSVIKIAFPVASLSEPKPLICSEGQHIFAFLPVARLPQLPFLIHADFILAASRQAVMDNSWNRRLRFEIAQLFAHAVVQLVQKDVQYLSLTWMRLLPSKQIDGFWSPLLASIQNVLKLKAVFLTFDDQKKQASLVRLVPTDFLHSKGPLLELRSPKTAFKFLSQEYHSSDHGSLKQLGIEVLSVDEMIDLIAEDIVSQKSLLMTKPFTDKWHHSFLRLLAALKRKVDGNPGSTTSKKFSDLKVIPVMTGRSHEWWAIGSVENIFLPNVFEEGSGDDVVSLQVPTDVGLTTLRTAACSSAQRKASYREVGVQDCSPERVCDAILAHQHDGKSKWPDDLLRYLEILFWFSYPMDYSTRSSLQACHMGGGYGKAKGLFFQSNKPYDAAQLMHPHEKPEHRKYFLDEPYQKSCVSSRVRSSLTWEFWLKDTVGVRWFPPLRDDSKCGVLHPVIRIILEENPREFLPMLQAHWTTEYAGTCRSCPKVKAALQTSLVLCQNGERIELQKTWFPSHVIQEEVKKYGMEQQIPLLDLPGWREDCDITVWTCLNELGIPANPQISLHKQILSTLAQHHGIETNLEKVELLYHIIGQQANMNSQKELQEYFANSSLVWNAKDGWCLLSDCVWESPASLTTKFVITSFYNVERVKPLFKTLLGLTDATISTLIEELVSLQTKKVPPISTSFSKRITSIYAGLNKMVSSSEIADVRANFRTHRLIFCNGHWLGLEECVWHPTTATIGQRTPIASAYPGMQSFFVQILGVQKVTDSLMIKELVKLASKEVKNVVKLQQHMLATAALLTSISDSCRFSEDIEKLRQIKFLPCLSSNGSKALVATNETFLIADNDSYRKQFEGKLTLLDFTYEDFNTLHPLFRLLGLGENRYLSKYLCIRTNEGESTMQAALTERFRECAFALSCCAVQHRSPLFDNKAQQMHNSLRQTTVQVSSTMQTVLVVEHDGHEVKVDSNKIPLVIDDQGEKLRIVVPTDELERESCFRNRLPTMLCEVLKMKGEIAQRQVYRILNETDLGADDIMAQEDIPAASWLQKTFRLPPTPAETTTSHTVTSDFAAHVVADIHTQQEPPGFHKVLEHVRRQARSFISRNINGKTFGPTHGLTGHFEALAIDTNKLELEARSELFGTDELGKFRRIGAAGELFSVAEYQNVTIWKGIETADITYVDSNRLFQKYVQGGGLGEVFPSEEHSPWFPDWLDITRQHELEWLFEIKATTGPCETACYMSPDQYEQMRRLASVDDADRKQVYCLVRVYHLLSEKIGVRIYVDPWRYREHELEFNTTDKWIVKAK